MRACRVCGCTEDKACLDGMDVPCHWVEKDLCSCCVGKQPKVKSRFTPEVRARLVAAARARWAKVKEEPVSRSPDLPATRYLIRDRLGEGEVIVKGFALHQDRLNALKKAIAQEKEK